MSRLYKICSAAAICLLALLSAPLASAQQVAFSTKVTPVEQGVSRIDLTATIDKGWHIYDTAAIAGGPQNTIITFDLPEGASLEGEMSISPAAGRHQDEVFGCEVGTWEGTVVFSQTIRHSAAVKVGITAEYMTCTGGECSMPAEQRVSVTLGGGENTAGGGAAAAEEISTPEGRSAISSDEGGSASKGALWAMILEAILWGFAALLTPCVFPMVPMTISFFIKGSENKTRGRLRAIMYGVFIVLLYTVPIAAIIIITRLVGGDAVTADIFNYLATHWLPNILFFVIFMVFAASFFGAFEITMPSSLVNKSDQAVDKRSGLGGVFFMALTLVLVSFSCTGPIVGTVLIKSTAGEFWAPIVTMLAFSAAFALPFVIFALFPGLLKKLPGSGGWLNSVKVVLGFVEIALGFKFLSTADQVYHWGLLDREVYLAIWIVVFTLLGFYLLGKLRFKYDSPKDHISVLRLGLAIVVFTFVVYMIPGMWGAPLKALSGYLPPIETQDFVIGRYSCEAAPQTSSKAKEIKYADRLELPHGLQGYFDLGEATAAAKREGKNIFLAFTGHGCVNCREMEARVWSDAGVLAALKEDFIICMLYCDDRSEALPEDWITTSSGRTLKTIGKINAHIANENYGINAQPYYVIQTPEGKVLSKRGYNLDAAAFKGWLSEHAN